VNAFTDVWNDFASVFPTTLEWVADQVSFLGSHRWAAAIVLLTLAIRTVLLPLAVKQIRSQRSMQLLQPEVKRLQQKHRKDRQKLQQETMELYRREGVNPLGGCLPMVAQFPILYAMFFAIRDLAAIPFAVREAFLHGQFGLGAVTGIDPQALARSFDLIPKMPLVGLGDLGVNAGRSAGGWILLAIMTGSQIYSMRQLQAGQTSQQNRMMQLMPLFFLFIMINFPAGLVLYWTTQNVYQLVQQTVMLRLHPLPKPEAAAKQPGRRPANRPRSERPPNRQNQKRRSPKSNKKKRRR